jgi:hypothetical protein|nr:MAG TPA: ssDNA binding protein [Caudoviricetes sp.]
MINIISNQEYNEIEKYLMTISPAIESMKNLPDGEKIPVKKYMFFEDVKENTGETVEILSILTPDNKVYSAQSGTVKRSFNDIVKIMGDKPFTVIKTSGKTKAGRDFINCILDVESIA